MIKFTTQELEIESNLKQRIEFIFEFCHVMDTIQNKDNIINEDDDFDR